ncbi:glycosyltransferase [Novipirellula sp.]|uniref:glycosyltransferase n=1 Tax=Novipirellula sp. TaxID=2795430 RepID=UPI00356AA11A
MLAISDVADSDLQLKSQLKRKPRILFIAEAVTLCHVTRPLVLAEGLGSDDYEVHFACCQSKRNLVENESRRFHSIDCVGNESFIQNLSYGRPAFSKETLVGYVEQDLELLQSVRPDLVIGDMRLSLAISARKFGVPYWTLTNAYWSPYANQPWVVPELPVTKLIGSTIANPFFKAFRRPAFAMHCRPLNQASAYFSGKPLGYNLEKMYTDADEVLYADAPGLVPTYNLPHSHHYLGPILWSSPGAMPDKWKTIDPARKTVFVTLGSSGPVRLLPTLVSSLADADPKINVLVATSGRVGLDKSIRNRPNVLVADYLPAEEASKHSDLVICHGGSASAYVALASETPVLGIPSILDQHLTIEYIRCSGAGESLRAEDANESRIVSMTQQILGDPGYANAARKLAKEFSSLNPSERFRQLLERSTVIR